MPAENCHHRFDVTLFHGRWGSEFDTHSCDCPLSLSRMIARCSPPLNICRITCSSWISFLSRWRKWFVSLNGINTLVTFRQPWHNCAINVTDSFAGSSWLALNHNCITGDTEDITFNSVQWHAFVSLSDDVKHFTADEAAYIKKKLRNSFTWTLISVLAGILSLRFISLMFAQYVTGASSSLA